MEFGNMNFTIHIITQTEQITITNRTEGTSEMSRISSFLQIPTLITDKHFRDFMETHTLHMNTDVTLRAIYYRIDSNDKILIISIL